MVMNEKAARHEALLELLRSRKFASQQAVAEALERLGYEVTQASVSRDFHELGISKVGGRYVARLDLGHPGEFGNLVLEVETASASLVVVKTPGGGAGIVAGKVDKMNIPGVVGTIAGDDTVFVATKGRAAQSRLRALLIGGRNRPSLN